MKLILTLCCTFIFTTIFSQETIRIPDVGFEEALIALDIDTNGLNGTILVSDARYVVNLNIFDPANNKDLKNVNSKIKDLTGIEYFTNLKRLVCYGNEISKLDLSKNKLLTFLNCSQNKLTELDVSNNPELFFMSCDGNKLSSLTLGIKSKLTELYCNANSIKNLNLKDCSVLEAIDISGNQIEKVIVSNTVINAIPEGWYKDDKTTYTTETEKTTNSSYSQSSDTKSQVLNVSNVAKKPTAKVFDEAFKKQVVSEFEQGVSEYTQTKRKELQLKYNIDSTTISDWILQYGKVFQPKSGN